MIDRATFLGGITSLAGVTTVSTLGATQGPPNAALARLEARYGGRLGVYAFDAGSGAHIGHRADESFPMCSTFKAILVAAVLARVDDHRERLDRRVHYGAGDMLDYAPISRKNLAFGTMTVRALCAAAMTVSDNTAANLLLREIGGPPRVTAFARSIGDVATRLDRAEPALNSAIPNDPRDTTTPRAMARTLLACAAGDALSPASRARFVAWLAACETGVDRIRKGIPASWHAGDKTGSGAYATTNDIAVLTPPRRRPIVVTAYYTGSSGSDAEREAVLADVGRIARMSFVAS